MMLCLYSEFGGRVPEPTESKLFTFDFSLGCLCPATLCIFSLEMIAGLLFSLFLTSFAYGLILCLVSEWHEDFVEYSLLYRELNII